MKNAPLPTSTTASATRPPASTSTTAAAPEATIGQIQKLLWQLASQAAPAAPGLHLSPTEVDQLAARLGLASTVTGASILAAIDRLAAVRIGDIRLPFTPGQLAELQHRAAKRGRTVEAEMRAVVARIENELFYNGG